MRHLPVRAIAIVAFGLMSARAIAQTEAWVARYNWSGNSTDNPYALAVDDSGNVYVTGYSFTGAQNPDYATVKYDSQGNELWAARYAGPGTAAQDFAEAIAVDTFGNVYVTGGSDGSGTGRDYATIKYDPEGAEIWVARYNGPRNNQDWAHAIAVDGAGNVYVTGDSGGGIVRDYATIKYDREGAELWVARYNGPADLLDAAAALAIDAAGNVYVTGKSIGIDTVYDYATIKYDRDGAELWVARYDGPGNHWDWAAAIAVDSSGYVYVTGDSRDSAELANYATIKYDPEGTELWVARYSGPEDAGGYAHAIAIDGAGQVYVTGEGWRSDEQYDFATIKYDAAGEEFWAARYNGDRNLWDGGYAVALDAAGNVYVTGYTDFEPIFGPETDCATIKYDPDGEEMWVAKYNGPADGSEIAAALAVDGAGRVYVTGMSDGLGTGGDYATIKYVQPTLGDLNCDGALNGADIDPFGLALLDPAGYQAQFPGCDFSLADFNGDGQVDELDIPLFVQALLTL